MRIKFNVTKDFWHLFVSLALALEKNGWHFNFFWQSVLSSVFCELLEVVEEKRIGSYIKANQNCLAKVWASRTL